MCKNTQFTPLELVKFPVRNTDMFWPLNNTESETHLDHEEGKLMNHVKQ